MNSVTFGLVFGIILLVAVVMVYLPLRRKRKTALLVSSIVIVLCIMAYVMLGTGIASEQYYQQQAQQAKAEALADNVDPNTLIQQFLARLEKTPKHAEGWYLLGKLYAGQGDWVKANEALQTAHELQPAEVRISVYFVLTQWNVNQQQFTPESKALLDEVLAEDNQQPDALAMLAMDAFIRHAYPEAIRYWERLLSVLPAGSSDADAVRRAIAKAREEQNAGLSNR